MHILQDPIKAIHFSNSNPVCHAFDSDVKDGHDLLIGLQSGDGKFGGLFFIHFPLHFLLWSNANYIIALYNNVLNGDLVYSVSLRQQLQDLGKKLVGAQHYNKDGAINNRHVLLVLYT